MENTEHVELLLDRLQDIGLSLKSQKKELAKLLAYDDIPDRLSMVLCSALRRVIMAYLSVSNIREDIRIEHGLENGRYI